MFAILVLTHSALIFANALRCGLNIYKHAMLVERDVEFKPILNSIKRLVYYFSFTVSAITYNYMLMKLP